MDTIGEVETITAGPELWLSADIGKKFLVASWRLTQALPAQPSDLKKMKTKKFERTQPGMEEFLKWGEQNLPMQGRLSVIMEATGPYSLEAAAWIQKLRPGVQVVTVRSRQMKDFITGIGLRNKTDKLDARAIAVYGAERRPAQPEPVGEEYLNLRGLTRMRQSLIEQLTQLHNQHDTITSEHLSSWLRKNLVKTNTQIIVMIEKQVDKLETLMRELINSHERLKAQIELLETIDGVAFRTATAVLGELGDLTRFRSCRQLTAFAGLNPVIKESADKTSKSRISKQGSSRARRALYMSAMAAVAKNEEFGSYYQSLIGRGKTKMTALVATMRRLLVLMRGLLKSEKAYAVDYKQACGKLSPSAPASA